MPPDNGDFASSAPPPPDSDRSRGARRLSAATRLQNAASETDFEERQAALRALLMNPLLPAADPHLENYRLVWRHAAYLREWLAKMAGWTLVLQAGLARLKKTPATFDDSTRPALDLTADLPLTRRRYALLCLVLAVLEHEDRQTTLEQVARRTQLLAAGDARLREQVFEFELTSLDCRRDLVCAIRLLESWRVLMRDDGDEQQFIRGSGDALYRIDRPTLASLLCVGRSPDTISHGSWFDRLNALHENDASDSDEARTRLVRQRLVRRLLDDPVVYFDQLTQHELDYFTSQRSYLLDSITTATGLVAEVRKEGVALLDPRGDLTDTGLPEAGTRGHATLLLAEWFAEKLRAEPAATVSWAEVAAHFATLTTEHAGNWKKGLDQAAAREALARDVVRRLESLGLLELRRGELIPRPAIARYALGGRA